ncbi:MAG: DUF305 domain-containing protein [Alkalispirochaeta sp.]
MSAPIRTTRTRGRTLIVGLAVVAVFVGAVGLFTPFIGPARFGPMRSFAMGPTGMGPMSIGMMREVRAMADVESEFEYMVRMIPHHQEAVESARTLRQRTSRREMEAFAETIIETQTREIEQMHAWLEQWYPERAPEAEAEYTPMMRDYSDLSGDELDLAFLQDMIPHHMAAVMMSQQLLSRVESDHPELDELAASIRSTQMQEIRDMSRWMERWFD